MKSPLTSQKAMFSYLTRKIRENKAALDRAVAKGNEADITLYRSQLAEYRAKFAEAKKAA